MNNSQYPYSGSDLDSEVLVDDVLLGSAVRRTFVWMALGLAITGLASHFVFSSNLVYKLLEGYTFWFLLIAEVALVLFLSGRVMKMSIPVATGAFVLYAVLSGVSLSPIYLAYTYESIATTFFITAGMFGAMAVYGYTTKRDLTSLGSILFMGLIGLVLAGIVNLFLGSTTVMWITSVLGVLIFTGLTAYDVQKVKVMLAQTLADEETSKRVSLLGALSLYLDFINLFLYLLRFFGRRD